MFTLIAFATQWGPKHGGINSFNADFLTAFGVAYHHSVRTVCVVSSANADEINSARNSHVELIPLPYSPSEKGLSAAHGKSAIAELQDRGILMDKDTVWLGHDRITGEAAIAAARHTRGRSALIHHMSYAHYEAYAESSASAQMKVSEQRRIFNDADILLAIGPLLRDALSDLLSGNGKPVHMVIPGLAEIDPVAAPTTFSAFLSGRLSEDASRIKQGHLGIAAFARAQREASENPGLPEGLRKQPKLKLRGVDLEQAARHGSPLESLDVETSLKAFAEEYADRVINLHALPFTHSREELYGELRTATVALMPSWHEGFGLVAWEAIAAGVPLIISKNSGVYQLLDEKWSGTGPGCVFAIDVRGKVKEPYFHDEDLHAVANLLKQIAQDPTGARQKASNLRALVGGCTWAVCAGQAIEAFGWPLQQGVIQESALIGALGTTSEAAPPMRNAMATHGISSALAIPPRVWKQGLGMADSQLLRAEEACVPFDPARQPELDKLHAWAEDSEWPYALRLITGAGGTGKTRLALEFCERLTKQGWHAGFLSSEMEANKATSIWRDLQQHSQPLLIVIDYAETRQRVLLELLKVMLKSDQTGKCVRLLLLARDGGEWWEQLPAKDALCEPLLNGRATSGPFILPELHSAGSARPAAYEIALQAYAAALGVPAPKTIPDLQGEHFGRPLYLQMAALLALHGERPSTAEGLTRALLNHENRYWQGLLANHKLADPARSAALLMSLSTLTGGFTTEREAEPFWKASRGPLENAAFRAMFHALANLYPGKQGLQVLRPDLLGETLVAQALLTADTDLLLDAVLGPVVGDDKRRHALTVLARITGKRTDLDVPICSALIRHFVRCATALVAVAAETPSRLTRIAEEAFSKLDPIQKGQAVGLLDPLLRNESIELAEMDCYVSEFIVDKKRSKVAKHNRPAELASLAEALQSSGVAHGWAGHLDIALSRGEEAVAVFGKLTKVSEAHQANYATTLGNYAETLNRLGQFESALDQAKPGLEIYRRLARDRPAQYEPNYAVALGNTAVYLGKVGRTDAALEHARAALEIRCRLAADNSERYDPHYAGSLNSTANILSSVGQADSALEHARKAMEIWRRLADTQPDRHQPSYARSLLDIADHLSEAGQIDEALEHANTSLEIFQRLSYTRPARYEVEQASSLINVANRLSEFGHANAAMQKASASLDIYTRLAKTRPSRFEDSRFIAACMYQFSRWLAGEKVAEIDVPEETALPNHLLAHQKRLLAIYSTFVRGCVAATCSSRLEAFNHIRSQWPNMCIAEQKPAQGHWLCAAAYVAQTTVTPAENGDWINEWEKFIRQRQNHLPWWMSEAARRLNFSWPTIQNSKTM